MIGDYRGHPIYLPRDLDDLDAATVAEVVAARKGPFLDKVDTRGAARVLGWTKGVFGRIASERGLPADRLGRYELADVRALAEDAELTARVRAELHDHAVRQARRNEERHEDALRNWMLRCTAFLDRTAEDPPDMAMASRALKGIAAARSAAADHSP
jgi:predicted amidohydrolase YtcJ